MGLALNDAFRAGHKTPITLAPMLQVLHKKPRTSRVKKVLSLISHEIHIESGQEYVIIMTCKKKDIIGDIQISPASGGAMALPKGTMPTSKTVSLNSLRVDFVSFNKHCTITRIKVHSIPNSSLRKVYINFKSKVDDPGEHFGKGTDYEKLVNSLLFKKMWEKVSIKTGDSKTSIRLKEPAVDQLAAAEMLLAFGS